MSKSNYVPSSGGTNPFVQALYELNRSTSHSPKHTRRTLVSPKIYEDSGDEDNFCDILPHVPSKADTPRKNSNNLQPILTLSRPPNFEHLNYAEQKHLNSPPHTQTTHSPKRSTFPSQQLSLTPINLSPLREKFKIPFTSEKTETQIFHKFQPGSKVRYKDDGRNFTFIGFTTDDLCIVHNEKNDSIEWHTVSNLEPAT